MADFIRGLHHVTSIAGAAQRNVDFYVGDLGLRLVKRTVNFDDPGTYHLYYGDREGSPGSIMTFFPWAHAVPGSSGPGATEATGFSVAPGNLTFWRDRLAERGIEVRTLGGFGGDALRFVDPDGMVVEISEEERAGSGAGIAGIDAERGIASFFGVFLDVPDPEASGRFLTDLFGYRSEGESEGRLRFRSPSGETADVVELRAAPSQSRLRMGRGSVHHVAFRATGEAEQLEWRERISSAGVPVTEVLDRQYFKSIYFREPGGVLYEIATDPPGFVKDEPVETLGRELKLPPWLEPRRADIEARLPDLVDPTVAS